MKSWKCRDWRHWSLENVKTKDIEVSKWKRQKTLKSLKTFTKIRTRLAKKQTPKPIRTTRIFSKIVWRRSVTTYPSAGGRRETQACIFQGMKTCRSRHQCLFKENIRKTKRGLQILRIKVRELFTCGEGISTPRVCHKGWQPLIKCAKSWLQYLFIFHFFMFFLSFGVDKSMALAPTYPQAWRRTHTYVVLKRKIVTRRIDFKLLKCSF